MLKNQAARQPVHNKNRIHGLACAGKSDPNFRVHGTRAPSQSVPFLPGTLQCHSNMSTLPSAKKKEGCPERTVDGLPTAFIR